MGKLINYTEWKQGHNEEEQKTALREITKTIGIERGEMQCHAEACIKYNNR